MLWRVASMAALPNAVSAVLVLDELRRLRERQAGSDTPATPPDSVGAHGNSRAHLAVMLVSGTVPGRVLGTVASTVFTVTDAAATATDATTQAAAKAAGSAFTAATRAAVAARDAVSSLGNQVTNTGRNAELRRQAEELAAFQGSKDWLDLMRALFAVGIAIAAADGEISESERYAIEEFVGGAGYSKLPLGLKADIEAWLATPPSIEQAFALASKCDEDGLQRIENVLEVIMQSDDVVHPAELKFREDWRAMREGSIP